jgi:hypothetical protein
MRKDACIKSNFFNFITFSVLEWNINTYFVFLDIKFNIISESALFINIKKLFLNFVLKYN